MQPCWACGGCLNGEIYDGPTRLAVDSPLRLTFREYLAVALQSSGPAIAAWASEVEGAERAKIESKVGHLLFEKEHVITALKSRLMLEDCAAMVPKCSDVVVRAKITGCLVSGESFSETVDAVPVRRVVPHAVSIDKSRPVGTLVVDSVKRYGVPVRIMGHDAKWEVRALEGAVVNLPIGAYAVGYEGRWAVGSGKGVSAVVREGEMARAALPVQRDRPIQLGVGVSDIPVAGVLQLTWVAGESQQVHVPNWNPRRDKWLWTPGGQSHLVLFCPGYRNLDISLSGAESELAVTLVPTL